MRGREKLGEERRGARRGALLVVGLAAGLAAGTKLNFLLPAAVLGARPGRGRSARGPRRACSPPGLAAVAGGGYWYLRNLAHGGNPLPWIHHLGPIDLPAPEQALGGREAHSVLGYLTDGAVWSDWFLPGLHHGLWLLWPAPARRPGRPLPRPLLVRGALVESEDAKARRGRCGAGAGGAGGAGDRAGLAGVADFGLGPGGHAARLRVGPPLPRPGAGPRPRPAAGGRRRSAARLARAAEFCPAIAATKRNRGRVKALGGRWRGRPDPARSSSAIRSSGTTWRTATRTRASPAPGSTPPSSGPATSPTRGSRPPAPASTRSSAPTSPTTSPTSATARPHGGFEESQLPSLPPSPRRRRLRLRRHHLRPDRTRQPDLPTPSRLGRSPRSQVILRSPPPSSSS